MVKMTYRYDEKRLIDKLAGLSATSLVAFAAACATRQVRNFSTFTSETEASRRILPSQIMGYLWEYITDPTHASDWNQRYEDVMSLMPEQDKVWTVADAIVEDAVASIAYAIRCLMSHKIEEAAWAARRAYESADQIVIRLLKVRLGQPGSEEIIKSHEVVQRELQRQSRDYDLLQMEDISKVRELAYHEAPLSDAECFDLKQSI